MSRLAARFPLILIVVAYPSAQAPAEKLDYVTIGRIRDEGLNRSQVMDHISWLSDVYGPRLTGSPGISQAADWATKKFNEWGSPTRIASRGRSAEAGRSYASTRT